ncbi:unnamed protein product (macronuclear) [Paramecium tetraurelia]|uniref:Uncharacterized protein n=1 Tax=Paramecium tetraurelia TaxID=5888 RepID=A0CBI0_PARTE|nr:uncharacterized protein GSPATT00036930001 [Paramecium tetraurelia]CAK68147.1 unnamed protein product [Paramecium tetraurelia]|eukprot:XP_001435544.1 hypothetical protein (macronuclear) [Paramecium tetraurelia strain d4-2]
MQKAQQTSRNLTQTQYDLQILGKASPINQKSRDQGFYSTRYKTSNERKSKEQGVLCDIFENVHINRTFNCQSQINSFDNPQTRLFTPETRVLKRRKNGKVVFQPIPRYSSPQRTYESPALLNITSYTHRKPPKVRRVINLNMLKDGCDKRPFFSDKGQNLYEFVYNYYQ